MKFQAGCSHSLEYFVTKIGPLTSLIMSSGCDKAIVVREIMLLYSSKTTCTFIHGMPLYVLIHCSFNTDDNTEQHWTKQQSGNAEAFFVLMMLVVSGILEHHHPIVVHVKCLQIINVLTMCLSDHLKCVWFDKWLEIMKQCHWDQSED